MVGEFAMSVTPRRAARGGIERFRQAEVEHLHGAVGRTLMFAGLRSRWMMPARARLRARRRSVARWPAPRRSGLRPRDALREVSPSTSSITSAVVAPLFFQAVDRGDVRVVQRRETSASRWKRASRSRSAATDAGRTLMATWRFSFVSVAR